MERVIETKTLPPTLRRALEAVEYHRRDVTVRVEPETYLRSAYGDGYQAFGIVVNLATGESQAKYGNWGGSNPYTRGGVDDAAYQNFPIPEGYAIITGQRGGGRPVSASISIGPANAARLLPAAEEDVSDRDREILYVFRAIKSGPYRQDEMRCRKIEGVEVDSLVDRGFLSRNRAGATQLTTKGKNEVPYSYHPPHVY